MKTGIIKYNLNERKRELTGQNRDFNIKKIANYINSIKFQENVKHRDVYGYLGHWVRQRFGLNPEETVVDKGMLIPIEPAILTISIKANTNGDIEHEVQFLDTQTGKVAKQMHESQVGGFSSVIDFEGRFYGFDYVKSPNFSTNRGYEVKFDASCSDLAFDDIITNMNEAMRYAQSLEAMNSELAMRAIAISEDIATSNKVTFDANAKVAVLLDEVSHKDSEIERLKQKIDDLNGVATRGERRATLLFDGVSSFYSAIQEHGDGLHKDDDVTKPVNDTLLKRLFR